MAERIVDVFLNDELVKSYPISLTAKYVIPNELFIAAAKQNMVKEGHSDDDVGAAKFVVRFAPSA
jgi:hypothetical protein